MSYPGHSLVRVLPLCRGTIGVFYSPSQLCKTSKWKQQWWSDSKNSQQNFPRQRYMLSFKGESLLLREMATMLRSRDVICDCREQDTQHHVWKQPRIACIYWRRAIEEKIDELCRCKLIWCKCKTVLFNQLTASWWSKKWVSQRIGQLIRCYIWTLDRAVNQEMHLCK